MSGEYFGFNSTQEKTLRELIGATAGGSVSTGDLANGAVTAAKLANDAVTSGKIADGAIVDADINASAAIAATKLAVAAGTNGLSAANLQVTLQAIQDYIVNLNTWAVTLATKLNADATDTGGDSDYDTNPQA